MVDRKDIPEMNDLYRQLNQLEQAISNLDNGGRINSMVIVGATPDVPSAIVSTQDWPYPQQMVDSIKQIIRQKEIEVIDKLKDLGITGLQATEPPAEPEDPQPTRTIRRKK